MICFTWNGFPQYAARCIGAFVANTKEKVVVVATRPQVPIEGMECFCNCTVYWVDEKEKIDTVKLLGEIPSCLFSSGWSVASFNYIAKEVKRAGGKVILQNDILFKYSLIDILKIIRFRLFIRHRYDAFFVPGEASARAMRIYGIRRQRIIQGVYAADDSLFSDGDDILSRPKKMIYVGQFCERKNVLGLSEAFCAAGGPENGWTLELYGCGPLKDALCKINPAIKVHEFLQPKDLSNVYKNARCFALASFEEPWGVVVHEAALSGCVLLLSDRVGASEDLLTLENGVLFDPCSKKSMVSAMQKVFRMDDRDLELAHDSSIQVAKKINKSKFIESIDFLLKI
ncbi:MAG: glycosyltransferase family 4 protein [Kiritimatiellae bacterium]|nr:glycosyltransferase family 4 protein [Kiritimatiellia bacterium]